MRVRLTRNEIVSFRTRGLSQLFDRMADAVGGQHGAPPSSESLYLTRLKVERRTRSLVAGSPECNLDPILDEVIAKIGACDAHL
jgi:hypothetical protein